MFIFNHLNKSDLKFGNPHNSMNPWLYENSGIMDYGFFGLLQIIKLIVL